MSTIQIVSTLRKYLEKCFSSENYEEKVKSVCELFEYTISIYPTVIKKKEFCEYFNVLCKKLEEFKNELPEEKYNEYRKYFNTSVLGTFSILDSVKKIDNSGFKYAEIS